MMHWQSPSLHISAKSLLLRLYSSKICLGHNTVGGISSDFSCCSGRGEVAQVQKREMTATRARSKTVALLTLYGESCQKWRYELENCMKMEICACISQTLWWCEQINIMAATGIVVCMVLALLLLCEALLRNPLCPRQIAS